MSYISPTLKVLITAIKKAANSLNRDFSEIEKLQSSVKDYRGFVVAAVEKVEKNLRFDIGKVKPDYPVVKELLKGSKTPYFLMSVDGTDNLFHGMGYFSVCIALCDENNNVTMSLVYNPAMDELYFAEKGNGAYKEGFRSHERLRVSSRKDLANSIVSTNCYYEKFANNLRVLKCISLEMAYLAAGKFDSVVSVENNVASLASGVLLVKEAGGYIYELNQQDIRSENIEDVLNSCNVFAVNNNLGKKIQEFINS